MPDIAGMPEDDQHREVYAQAGLALYFAQVMEYGIVNLILVARLDEPNLATQYENVDRFFAQHFRKATTDLVKVIRRKLTVSRQLEEQLGEAIRVRNLLVHELFRERIALFGSGEGRMQLVTELQNMTELFQTVDAALDLLLLQVGSKYGITMDGLQELADQLRAATREPG